MSKKRSSTSTYTFGTGKRESHDSSLFYERLLFAASLDDDDTLNDVPDEALGFHCADSRDLSFIPDNSVALMVTSPPYHAAKDYDVDQSFDDYLLMLEDVFKEVYRVLEPGGRAVVNTAGLGRKPYVPLPDLTGAIMRDIGYLMRGEVIWIKGRGMSGSAAFGSYMKASNPTLRDVHEYIQVYSKGQWGRVRKGESTIARDDFLKWTLSVWEMAPESARRVGHPAPFPVELPRRCIDLYTFVDDVVLDPFGGSGSTAIAAARAKRKFICVDDSEEYLELATTRFDNEVTGEAE